MPGQFPEGFPVGSIVLTNDEQLAFDEIDLSPDARSVDAIRANGKRVPLLMESLEARQAIPMHRILYFVDPAYTRLGKSSYRSLFKMNAQQMYGHYNFLQYFRYFVLGAHLPGNIVEQFTMEIGRRDWAGSSDAIDLSILAKKHVKSLSLNPHHASEEFFRLCLDCGVDRMNAAAIRERVRTMRIKLDPPDDFKVWATRLG
jgi:hypothetical protein